MPTTTTSSNRVSIYGGQTFRKSVFPPTKYIQGLLKAYTPDTSFDEVAFLAAFKQARTPQFDVAFNAVTRDGASCGMQLCWSLLDLPPATVLPLHAHKNLEVCYVLKGVYQERVVTSHHIAAELLKKNEIDWFDCENVQISDRSFPAGSVVLNEPGSIHQPYADRNKGCTLLLLYSKECTFIRGTDPVVARQILTATADSGAYHMTPLDHTTSSFTYGDPRYAKFRTSHISRAGRNQPAEVTVAHVMVKALADCGVRDAIVYPGAKCIELLKVVDSNQYGVKGWLCRNEHAGAFVAEGYNKSQGERLCAIMTTSGPGATNLCTGIASCWRDGVPAVIVTSQVPTYKTGTAAFQEVPVVELFKPITKGAFSVTCASQAYDMTVAACRLAVEGVQGPVVLDVPEDLQAELVALSSTSLRRVGPPPPSLAGTALSANTSMRDRDGPIPGMSGVSAVSPLPAPTAALTADQPGLRSHVACPIRKAVMREVMGHLTAARRPLLLLGGGCTRVNEAMLNELVDVLDMPVVYSFMGKGCISDDHPLCLGPIGVHGLYTANTAMAECDMVLALGTRFDERAACKSFENWKEPRVVVHVDITAQKVMSGSPKNPVTCSVVADVEDFVGVALQHLYGLIEERRRTLSCALPSMRLSDDALTGRLTELDDLSNFVVDEEDTRVLREHAAKEAAEAAAANGLPSEELSFAFKDKVKLAPAAGTKAAAPAPANGASPFAAAAEEPAAPEADAASPVTGATSGTLDMCNQQWYTYSDWSREMSEMKARRWRSLLPCLTANMEITTRSMVHLLDSFLSSKGLQPIVCSDVGSHQCLLTQYLRLHHPRQWLMEGGLASMGCGLPAAIGAAIANPGRTALAVAGDGGFAMTSQELMMAKVYNLDVKVIVTVNNRLQLVEQLEEETYESLDVFTFLGDPDHPHRPYPHFSKLAEAYGVPAVTAWTKQEVLDGMSMMFSRRGPFLLEVVALAERPQIKYWTDADQ